jgi:hypothetical protein
MQYTIISFSLITYLLTRCLVSVCVLHVYFGVIRKKKEQEQREKEEEQRRILAEVAALKAKEKAAELKAAQDEANRQRMLDMKLEMENMKMMAKNDVNVHKIYDKIAEMQLQAELEAAQRAEEEEERRRAEEERLRSAADADEGDGEEEEGTRLQRRIKKFLKVMKGTKDGTNSHPRRFEDDQKGNKFFMPMMFGDDIRFNPFDSENYERGWFQQQMLEDRQARDANGGVDPAGDYSDINEAVERVKLQRNISQQKQLYSVSQSHENPEHVTHVFRATYVDWPQYMQSTREQEGDGSASSSVSGTTLNPIVDNDSRKIRATRPAYRPTAEAKPTKLVTLYFDEEIPVVQLPLGHVIHEKIAGNAYRYYQVTHPSETSLLTVDLKCNSGETRLFLLWDDSELPTLARYDETSDCNELNGYCTRLTAAVPRGVGSTSRASRASTADLSEEAVAAAPKKDKMAYRPIIAVYSPHEVSEFTLWAVASTDRHKMPTPLERVSRLIQEFNVLAEHDANSLSEHFAVYRRDAHTRVVQEEQKQRETKLYDIQTNVVRKILGPNSLESPSEAEADSASVGSNSISDELIAMEEFIIRAGRLATSNVLHATFLAPSKRRGSVAAGGRRFSRMAKPAEGIPPLGEGTNPVSAARPSSSAGKSRGNSPPPATEDDVVQSQSVARTMAPSGTERAATPGTPKASQVYRSGVRADRLDESFRDDAYWMPDDVDYPDGDSDAGNEEVPVTTAARLGPIKVKSRPIQKGLLSVPAPVTYQLHGWGGNRAHKKK